MLQMITFVRPVHTAVRPFINFMLRDLQSKIRFQTSRCSQLHSCFLFRHFFAQIGALSSATAIKVFRRVRKICKSNYYLRHVRLSVGLSTCLFSCKNLALTE